MPRRRLIGAIGALLASGSWLAVAVRASVAGIKACRHDSHCRPADAVAEHPQFSSIEKTIEAQPARRLRKPRCSAIIPEDATITADDPGVQLLLRRQSADGTVSDLTRQAAWQVESAWFRHDRGGRLSPAARRRQGRGQGRDRRRASHGPDPGGAACEPSLGFCRRRGSHPDPPGLQYGKLPRQGRRSERLSSFAGRLRSRWRLSKPGPATRPAQARSLSIRNKASF